MISIALFSSLLAIKYLISSHSLSLSRLHIYFVHSKNPHCIEHHTTFQEMTLISLCLLSNPFHSHALLYHCVLYAVFQRMNKIILSQTFNTVKPVLSSHSKKTKNWIFKTKYHLMQVKSIAECSKRAFCNTFDMH